MRAERVCIDRIRKDGLIFAIDYSKCDHSTKEAEEVLFRIPEEKSKIAYRKNKWKDHKLKEGNCISIDYEAIDGKFIHKISKIEVWSITPDIDILLDL